MPERAAVWTYESPTGKLYDLLVPYRKEWRDYEIRIADLVSVLSQVEQRSVSAVVNSIVYVSIDVIQVRIVQIDAADSSIPWGQATSFIQNATKMLESVACSAHAPLPVFPAKSPIVVVEYLENLRMGQTGQGSFIVNILSPVKSVDQGVEPYERRVTKTLDRALALMSGQDQLELESNQAFSAGVSANLCESMSAMANNAHLRKIDVNISWAPAIPVTAFRSAPIAFSRETLQKFSSVGSSIREKYPLHEGKEFPSNGVPHALRGYITSITRPKQALDGNVKVEARLGNKVRLVNIHLTGDDFSRAALALKNRVPITCDGILISRGKRSLQLVDPTNLRSEIDTNKEGA